MILKKRHFREHGWFVLAYGGRVYLCGTLNIHQYVMIPHSLSKVEGVR